jgi:hypothetical protein
MRTILMDVEEIFRSTEKVERVGGLECKEGIKRSTLEVKERDSPMCCLSLGRESVEQLFEC